MTTPHTHGDIEIGFIDKGSLTLLLGGHRYLIQAGRMHFFWAAIPHQTLGCHDLKQDYAMHVSLSWFLHAGLPARLTRAILDGRFLVDPNPKNRMSDAECFRRWSDDSKAPSRQRKAVMAAEVTARLGRLSLDIDTYGLDSGKPTRATSIGAWGTVDRLMRFVAENIRKTLRIADMARGAGVHPRYAMTVFARRTGMSLNQYLTRCRIRNAQQLLLTTDRKVNDIALASGFRSTSRFYKAFVDITGTTPRHYRAS